jgi:hypothetical protein
MVMFTVWRCKENCNTVLIFFERQEGVIWVGTGKVTH